MGFLTFTFAHSGNNYLENNRENKYPIYDEKDYNRIRMDNAIVSIANY